jgi:hypothetical protein
MKKGRLLACMAMSIIACSIALASVSAETVTLQYLQKASQDVPAVIQRGNITSDSWMYEILKNISEKYGLILGSPKDKFNAKAGLTRNEAAVILVSLLGKIEQDKIEMSDIEKDRVGILKRELSDQMQVLTGKVAAIEKNQEVIQGSITKLEGSQKQNVGVGFGDNFKLKGSLQFNYTGNFERDPVNDKGFGFSIPVAELGFTGKLHKKIDVVANWQPNRYYNRDNYKMDNQNMMGDLYASTTIVPNNTFYIGQTRVPLGIEGSQSSLTLDLINRSQIARNYGNKRDIGLKVAGKYPFFEYYAGVYNGNAFNALTDNNPTKDIALWANVKPFDKNKKFGEFVLGAGMLTGKGSTDYNNQYNVFGTNASYKYKKAAIKFEYEFSDGFYSSRANTSQTTVSILNSPANVKSEGYVITGLYDFTNKLQGVIRFDLFNPSKPINKDSLKELTVGTNYFMNNNNLKFQLNYVYVDRDSGDNSQRIIAQTQYAF